MIKVNESVAVQQSAVTALVLTEWEPFTKCEGVGWASSFRD